MNNDCKYYINQISDYIDNSLSEDLINALEDHFLNCEKCKSFYEGIKNTINLYKINNEYIMIPHDLREQLLSCIDHDNNCNEE